MKAFILIAFSILAGTANAGISKELFLSVCTLKSDSLDNSLKENQSKYTFNFITIDGSKKRMIYSIDGIEGKAKLENNRMEILTTPGKHIFQFYYTSDFVEVYTDSLEIQNRHHSTYQINMNRNYDMEITVDKPVIYVYPQVETDVEINLNIKGEPTFFYPEYREGWNFTASPNGDLTFVDKTYNYLFWEASQNRNFSKEELNNGFNVKKENVIAFLEEKLTLAGLNSKEQADFITYWGPRLSANELNFVHFEFDADCDRYAELSIEPKPQTVFRIYILWMPIDQEIETEDQEIKNYNRDGFTVLEWGGSEVAPVRQNSLTLN